MIEFTDVQTWGPHHPVGVAIGSFTTGDSDTRCGPQGHAVETLITPGVNGPRRPSSHVRQSSYCFWHLRSVHCYCQDEQVSLGVVVSEGVGSLMAARVMFLCVVLCGWWWASVTTGADMVIDVHQVE